MVFVLINTRVGKNYARLILNYILQQFKDLGGKMYMEAA